MSSSAGICRPARRFIRFRLTADGDGNVGDGVYIDNVKAGCIDNAYDRTEFAFLDGTSMATPHVAGAAALALSLKPSATAAELKSALMSSGDPIRRSTGITVSGRRLNSLNLLNTISPPTTPPGNPVRTGAERRADRAGAPRRPRKTLAQVKIDRCKQTGRGRTLRLQCRLRDSDALRLLHREDQEGAPHGRHGQGEAEQGHAVGEAQAQAAQGQLHAHPHAPGRGGHQADVERQVQ